MSEWIGVDDRLPDDMVYILTYRPDSIDKVRVGQYKEKRGEFTGCYRVTHWMPLPEPPCNS